jgi:sialic acid synthase SpsE
MDLDDDAHRWFVEECARAGIRPLTTVFTRGRVPFLASLPWNAVKVASYDCASYPLLEDLKGQFAHLFVSTGATEDDEIESAARLLAEVSFTFLHCVTIYPTPLDKLHLARLEWLRRWAPSVGFSDHTLVARDGLKAAVAALYLGADVIERHYTVLPRERVRDGPVSVDPAELRALVEFARRPRGELHDYVRREIPELEAMLGTVHRNLSEDELLNRDYYRGRFASRIGDEVIYNWQDYTFQRTEPGS